MNKRFRIALSLICAAAVVGGVYAYKHFLPAAEQPSAVPVAEQDIPIGEKVDKIVASMSEAEKVGQMVMIGVQGEDVNDDSLYMLHQYHIGNVILFDRNMKSKQQVKNLTGDLQIQAGQKVPIFIGVDEEGGDVVRMADDLEAPPSQQEIGASADPQKAKEWALKTGAELKAIGINTNFAPVADVGSKDTRSYSTDANTVTEFVRQASSGYEENNIMFSLKHFPGIGRGEIDSHVEASDITASKEELMASDLVPFKTMINEKQTENYFILVSHLHYPALDAQNPASLSALIMTDLLRNELGYKGIIITDDMEMGAVANHYSFRDVGVKAVQAGADIVMVCHEYEHETDVYLGLLEAVQSGTLSKDRVDESVKRIVKAKLMHLY